MPKPADAAEHRLAKEIETALKRKSLCGGHVMRRIQAALKIYSASAKGDRSTLSDALDGLLSRVPLSDDGVVISVEQSQMVHDLVGAALAQAAASVRSSQGAAEAAVAIAKATKKLRVSLLPNT